MTLYTTYRRLAGSALTNQCAAFTGSPASYGIDTPIYLGPLASAGYLQTAMSALPYCVAPWLPTAQLICIKMVEQMLYVWNNLQPGDSRAQRLTYFVEQLINGVQIVPNGQMTDLASTLQEVAAALPTIRPYTLYNFLILESGVISPLLIEAIENSYGMIVPPGTFQNPVLNTTFSNIEGTTADPYTPVLTTTGCQKGTFVGDTFTYSTEDAENYYLLTVHNPTVSTLSNFESDALTAFTQALSLCVNQTIIGTASSANAIYTLLRNAQVAYNNQMQYILRPLINELGQGATGRVPIYAFPDPSTQAFGQQIFNDGLNIRAQYLMDYNYVLQFDTNGDNYIEGSERIAMERDVQKQVQAAQLTSSNGIFATQLANYVSYSTAPDSLLPIFVEYA